MSHDLWLRRACWCFAVAGVLVSGALARAQAPAFDEPVFGLVQADDVLGFVDRSAPTYWLGLICDNADATLRSHLKLKEVGLVVRDVAADAPAANAGVKVHDVLLGVGDTDLKEMRGLAEAVEKSAGQEITLRLLREGEKITLKATPVKRDQVARFDELPTEVRRWIELRRAGPDGIRRWESVLPGAVPGIRAMGPPHKLPKDMSVTLVKEGESPAKITVKQGDKKWEVAEDKLKDLPDEIRQHVAPMVRPGAAVFSHGMPSLGPRAIPFEFGYPATPPGAAPDRKLEKQVDELRKQIEKLHKAVEELSKPK